MRKLLIVMLTALVGTVTSYGQESFVPQSYTAKDGFTLKYQELKPSQMRPKKKYPLVIFLHGMGERGSDNTKQLTHGSQMFLNPANQEKHPAFVIFPQCPEDKMWAGYKLPRDLENLQTDRISVPMQAVKELIDIYLQNPSVDPSRVYIMGLSMGGIGTYDIVSRYPDTFAAAIPICGAADEKGLAAGKKVRWRIYHGDADPVVPVNCSRKAYKALKKAGAKVEYFEFPGCQHISWNLAFSQPDFMEWLFKQKR